MDSQQTEDFLNNTLTAPQVLEIIKERIQTTLKMNQVSVVGEIPKSGYIRQGDLYITLGDIANKGSKRDSLQLVPGNTTGSRHCIIDSPHVTSYESLAKPFEISVNRENKIARFPGPLIIALSEWSVNHPKHGWMTKIFAGVFQTWNQCDYTRQRQVRD